MKATNPAKNKGFSFIEVTLLVSVLGVLTMVGIPKIQEQHIANKMEKVATNLDSFSEAVENCTGQEATKRTCNTNEERVTFIKFSKG